MLCLLIGDIDAWNPNLTSEERQRWENRNAFLAQLTAAAQVNYTNNWHHPMDFSLFGLWALRTAFENETPAEEVPGDTTVRVACWWYIYAADRLWANVENGRVFEGKVGCGWGKYQNKSWTGYNRERWAVWEEGLVATKTTWTDRETKKLLEDTLACIKRVVAE